MSPSPAKSPKTSAPTEADLTAAILRRWPTEITQPRFICAVQVHNGAGHSYSRRLDAIVFDTWPSAGLHLYGLEAKTTKQDLRRELQQPAKFEAFEPHLDFFSIVAPKGIVDLALLPAKWGLYILGDDDKLVARRKPLKLHDEKRRTLSRSMAAAFMRALVDRSLSDEAKKAEFERGQRSGELFWEPKTKEIQRQLEEHQTAIAEFYEASGINLHTWSGRKIGEAVNLVLKGGITDRIRYSPDIRKLAERLIELADQLDDLKEAFGDKEGTIP